MDERLYLNGKLVDLGGVSIVRKLQTNDVADVGAIKSSYSYTIKLPMTSKNVEVFDMLSTVGNRSRKPYEYVSCDYVISGVYHVDNGKAIIKESNGGFNVNILNGNVSLVDIIGEKMLSELEFEDIKHFLHTSFVATSMGSVDGYIYAVANYGRDVGYTMDVQDFAPSVYLDSIFSRILFSNGLSRLGTLFNNEKYLKEVVTASVGFENNDRQYSPSSLGNANISTITRNETTGFFKKKKYKLSFNDVSLESSRLGINTEGNIYYKTSSNDHVLNMNIVNSMGYTGLVLQVNQIAFSGAEEEVLAFIDCEKNGTSFKKQLLTEGGIGGELIVYVIESTKEKDYEINYTLDLTINVESEFVQNREQLISFDRYIDDIKQIDIIKDVVKRYGVVINKIEGVEEYEFNLIEEILADIEGADDWSTKVSSFNGEKYTPELSKINNALFTYEEGAENKDGVLLLDNENIEESDELFTSIFEIPKEDETVVLDKPVYNVKLWSGEEMSEANIRVMTIETLTSDFTLTQQSEDSVIISNAAILSLNNIDMQEYIDENYNEYKLLMNDYRERSVLFNLSVIDIYSLRFDKLKFIKETGRYYYLNSVQYQAGKVAKAVLIEKP